MFVRITGNAYWYADEKWIGRLVEVDDERDVFRIKRYSEHNDKLFTLLDREGAIYRNAKSNCGEYDYGGCWVEKRHCVAINSLNTNKQASSLLEQDY